MDIRNSISSYDYQGNIVGVYNTRTNTLEQLTNYYPYGLPHASISSEAAGAEVSRRKFGGKELMSDHGYNSYDFAARHQNPAFPHFTTPDPLLEKYYPISPFAYCAGDPINLIDPTGMDFWYVNLMGEVINRIEDKDNDKIIIVDTKEKNHEKTDKIVAEVSFDYGTIEKQRSIPIDGKNSYDIYQIRGDENATKAFEFLSNNLSVNPEDIEFSLIRTGENNELGLNFITTSHEFRQESGAGYLIRDQLRFCYYIREHIHSHPENRTESKSDLKFARYINERHFYNKFVQTKIYYVPQKSYHSYTTPK